MQTTTEPFQSKFNKSSEFNKSPHTKADGPISYGWLPLGMGRGVKWVLWKSNVTFQRQEKQGDRWLTTEELHLAPKILKEIVWRIPSWLESIEKNSGGSDESASK